MGGIGHNQGPTMEPGGAWRRYAWTRARSELLPKLPLEVVRMRVRRARELGLDYKAYASIRAASGHDVVALLFSSNALRLLRGNLHLPLDRALALKAVRGADRWALINGAKAGNVSSGPGAVLQANPEALDWAASAPRPLQPWSATAADLARLLADRKTPGDRVVLVGDTSLEREWLAAGRLAGYVSADSYFAPAP